jgi:hypothetical protein
MWKNNLHGRLTNSPPFSINITELNSYALFGTNYTKMSEVELLVIGRSGADMAESFQVIITSDSP